MPAITQLIPGTRPGESYGEFRVFGSNPSIDDSLNLYTLGGYPYSFMPLYLYGSYPIESGTMPLVLWNVAVEGSLNLYLSGEGSEPGAFPLYGTMNLYIECPIGAVMNLYTSGEDLPSDDGPFTMLAAWGGPGQIYGDFTQGIYYGTGSMNLVMPNTSAFENGSMILYCHGF